MKKNNLVNGDWGLGIGDWGLGIGDWGLGPIPNPQSPLKIQFLCKNIIYEFFLQILKHLIINFINTFINHNNRKIVIRLYEIGLMEIIQSIIIFSNES